MLSQSLDDFIDQYTDPRFKGRFSIWQPIIIVAVYMLLVQKIGPWFMKKRKPYNIKKLVIVFDAIQVAANLYFVIQVAALMIRDTGSSYSCLEIDLSESYKGRHSLFLAQFYYWLKVTDLLDTIFFVMKKNWRQVSYLHVYHHSIMVLTSWLCQIMVPGGHSAYVGVANAFVHTFMYTYYLLTAYDPSFKKNITIKKFITQLQMTQFVFILLMYTPALRSSCSYPKSITLLAIIQAIYFLYLFGDFYYHTYIKTNQGDKQSKVKSR